MKLREAAQQALEALEWHLEKGAWGADIEGVTAALRAALAEPVQEPVAWRYQDARGNYRYRGYVQGFDKEYSLLKPVPLYAAPPQRPAKPVQEPVASLMTNIQSGDREVVWNDDGFDRALWHETFLYTTPQPAPDDRETWGIPHASTIRCLRAAEDRIRAGDDPAEVFADFGWAMVRNELRCSEVLRRAGHSVSGMCLECGKGPCLLRAPAPQPALVTLIEEKIAGMTPTEVAQFMRDRAALREQPEQEPVAHVVVMETGGNAGLATRIVEIDDPFRERLRPGTKLYTAPQPAPDDKLREAAWRTLEALRGFAYHGRAEDWTDAASALRAALEGK